jgi:hypothetical protein
MVICAESLKAMLEISNVRNTSHRNVISMKTKLYQTNTRLPQGARKVLSGFPGFFGFIGFEALRAFPTHNPWFFFLFGLFAIFTEFRYWKDELKYLGLAGLLGLIVPALWALGVFKL